MFRRKVVGVIASAVVTVSLLSPVASAQSKQIISLEEYDGYSAEFIEKPDKSDDIESVTGIPEEEIAEFQEMILEVETAGPPQSEIIPGLMWSDKVGVPEGVDKADADRAEVAIARERSQMQAMNLRTTATRCRTFWPMPYQVCGAILDRYEQQGAALSWLLLPMEPQSINPDGQGYRQRFMGGSIYWHPGTGAHAVSNISATVWERQGWESGVLGYPLGGEVPVQGSHLIDGEINGWVQVFQGGRIYRSPALEGFTVASVSGAILDKWLEMGGPQGYLGFPLHDEVGTPDMEGRYSTFRNGMIYWTEDTGAHPVSGEILMEWAQSEFEDGPYGYPIADPVQVSSDLWSQQFEYGTIKDGIHGGVGFVPYGSRAGYAESGGANWSFLSAVDVRDLPSGQQVNNIALNFNLGISALDRVILTAEYESLMGVPFIMVDSKCVVKKHVRFSTDPVVGNFNCSTDSLPRTKFLTVESALPAAEEGDGEYYMQVDFSLDSGWNSSPPYRFQSQRWTCVDDQCVF